MHLQKKSFENVNSGSKQEISCNMRNVVFFNISFFFSNEWIEDSEKQRETYTHAFTCRMETGAHKFEFRDCLFRGLFMSVTDCSQDLIMEYTMKYFLKKQEKQCKLLF